MINITNISVLFIIFNRPKTTSQVFQSIRLTKPSKIYIAADGPRKDRVGEDVICEQTRAIIKNIDWPCEVHTLFRSENIGCHNAVPLAISWFFSCEDFGIIIEDDCLFSNDFFCFCADLNNRYRYNNDIMMISGDNFQYFNKKNKNEDCDSYYYSKYANIWGWATWKRAWSLYCDNFSLLDDSIMKEKINNSFIGLRQKRYWYRYYKKIKYGNNNNWDAKWSLSVIYNNGVCITPKINLVKNIGFGPDATATIDDNSMSIEIERLGEIIHPNEININKKADKFLFDRFYYLNIFKRLFLKIKSLFK